MMKIYQLFARKIYKFSIVEPGVRLEIRLFSRTSILTFRSETFRSETSTLLITLTIL